MKGGAASYPSPKKGRALEDATSSDAEYILDESQGATSQAQADLTRNKGWKKAPKGHARAHTVSGKPLNTIPEEQDSEEKISCAENMTKYKSNTKTAFTSRKQ